MPASIVGVVLSGIGKYKNQDWDLTGLPVYSKGSLDEAISEAKEANTTRKQKRGLEGNGAYITVGLPRWKGRNWLCSQEEMKKANVDVDNKEEVEQYRNELVPCRMHVKPDIELASLDTLKQYAAAKAAAEKRGRGRPPGSKNKPKIAA